MFKMKFDRLSQLSSKMNPAESSMQQSRGSAASATSAALGTPLCSSGEQHPSSAKWLLAPFLSRAVNRYIIRTARNLEGVKIGASKQQINLIYIYIFVCVCICMHIYLHVYLYYMCLIAVSL